jgi:hypothetical protein
MSWIKIKGEALQRLQKRLEMPPQCSLVEASTLQPPFYQNGELVQMNDGLGPVYMVAAGPGEISTRAYYPLNGTNSAIQAAIEAAILVSADVWSAGQRHFC